MKAFKIANEYRSKFEPYRAFYEENEHLDANELTSADHGWCNIVLKSFHSEYLILHVLLCIDVVFFRKWLGRYRLEHIQAKVCPTEKDLGLILIDTNQLKAQLLPSPIKCIEVHELRTCIKNRRYYF